MYKDYDTIMMSPTFMIHLMLHALISMIHGLIDVYYIKHQRLQLIDIS